MKEIKSHTALRGIAALLVAYYHLDLGMPDGAKSSNQTMLVENSYIFVDLFFFYFKRLYSGICIFRFIR